MNKPISFTDLSTVGTSDTEVNRVIEALYELPLGGEWRNLQQAMCAYWAATSNAAPQDELRLLERHFARAMSYMERLPLQPNRWFNELHRLPVAACVVDTQGSVVDRNSLGQQALNLDARDDDLDQANRTVLRTSIAAVEDGAIGSGTLQIQDRAVHVYLRRLPAEAEQSHLYLVVAVSADLPDGGFRIFAESRKLTPRELNLCLELASGMSLDDLAQKAQVKKTTLRTHLANCFGKLGVNSQPELVALVLHHMFAGAQLNPEDQVAPRLTPYIDPEIHGFPRFSLFELADGRKLGYFEYGDPEGVPAIYCHGSFETGMLAKSQRLHGNGVRVLAVERPGIGESSTTDDYSSAAYARDLVELTRGLGWSEYAVIGRSMGSWDAIELALADPERVKLLLFASCKLPVEHSSDHDRHLPVYRSLYNAIWQSDTMGRLMLRVLQMQVSLRGPEQFINTEGLPELEQALNESPLHVRMLKANWQRCGLQGVEPLHEHLKLYQHPVPNPPWKNLTTPTVLVHGDMDANVPLDVVLRQTDSFQNRTVHVLPGIGHQFVHMAMGDLLRILRREWAP